MILRPITIFGLAFMSFLFGMLIASIAIQVAYGFENGHAMSGRKPFPKASPSPKFIPTKKATK